MKSTRNRVRTLAAATAVAAACGIGGASFAGAKVLSTSPAVAAPAASAAHTPAGDDGTVSLDGLKAQISAAIDQRITRIQAIAQRVAASERLSQEKRAQIAEVLADKKAALTKLKSDVNAQTSKDAVVKVLRDARRDGTVRWWGGRDHRWAGRGDSRDDVRHSDRGWDSDRDRDGDRWGDHDGDRGADHDGDRAGDRDRERDHHRR